MLIISTCQHVAKNLCGGPYFDHKVHIDFSGVIWRKFSTAIPRRLKAYAIMRKRPVCNGHARTHQTVLLENFPADNSDAVDGIASRIRHLHDLRQVVLLATLTEKQCVSRSRRLHSRFINRAQAVFSNLDTTARERRARRQGPNTHRLESPASRHRQPLRPKQRPGQP